MSASEVAELADNWKSGEYVLVLKGQLLLSVTYRNAIFQKMLKMDIC